MPRKVFYVTTLDTMGEVNGVFVAYASTGRKDVVLADLSYQLEAMGLEG